MRSRRMGLWLSTVPRIGVALVMAALLSLPTLPSASPTSAADPDPSARVLVKVNSIYTVDDSDWGAGEMRYKLVMQRTRPGCGGVCYGDKFEHMFAFSANDHTTKYFEGSAEQFVPFYRTQPDNLYVQPQPGLDLYPGDSLLIRWHGKESDEFFDDFIGSFEESFSQGQNWGMGSPHVSFSNNTIGFGGFTVNYEIVRAPLPDLMVTGIRVGNFADNGDDIVCVEVENVGPEPAGPYTLRFYVDGVIPRNGLIREAGTLGPVGHLERCFQTNIPGGQHVFLATLDEDQEVAEMDEFNNRNALTATILRLGPAGRLPTGSLGEAVLDPGAAQTDPGPGPSPTATSTPSTPDIVPTSLRIRGVDPGEQCESGRRDVNVQIRNQGGADAGPFAVQLLVDDDEDDGGKETVQSLARAQQRDVSFDNIRLRKGDNQLTVKVDSENRIAESVETNNELKMTVSCKDDDD